jgi:hypothetical protein
MFALERVLKAEHWFTLDLGRVLLKAFRGRCKLDTDVPKTATTEHDSILPQVGGGNL